MKAKQNVYLDAERKPVVGGPDARSLLVRAGQDITEEQVAQHVSAGQEITEEMQGHIDAALGLIGAEPTKAATKGDKAKNLQKRGTGKGK